MVYHVAYKKVMHYARWLLLIILAGNFIQCVNPQITGDSIVLWRDINSLDEIHTGRFAWGQDRLVTERLDTLFTPKETFRLMAREITPTRWNAQDGGCLRISAGIKVTLGYFQFQGAAPTDTLIIVDGGSLELIGCDIFGPAGGGIIVRNGGKVTLSRSRIQDITQPFSSRNSVIDFAYVQVKNARESGVVIQGGTGHRLKGLDVQNIDGSGVVISNSPDARFSQIKIAVVSGDGIQSTHMGQFQLDSIQIQKAGGRGLFLTDIENLRIWDTKISDSELAGVVLEQVNQSHLVRVTSTKNGQDGLRASLFDTLKISQSLLYKNGQRGGAFEQGINLRISNGVSSENQLSGLWIYDVDSGYLDSMQVKLNQVADSSAGVFLAEMDSLIIRHSEIQYNVGNGMVLGPMPQARLSSNAFYKNVQSGAVIRSVGELDVTENHFARNVTGLELVGIRNLIHQRNVYEENVVGLVAKESNLQSEKNEYSRHEMTGIELLDSRFSGRVETLAGNRFGLTGVGGSLEFHNGYLVENGVGIFVKTSPVYIQETRFERGETGIQLKDVTTGMIQNSHFAEQTRRAINVEESATVILTNNNITDTPLGISLKGNEFVNFSRNEIRYSSDAGLVWDWVENGVIRFNLLVKNEVGIRVTTGSQLPAFENNTMVENDRCFQGVRAQDLVVQYNIFQANRIVTQEPMGPAPGAGGVWEYNCLWKNESVPDVALDKKAGNFVADPVFQQQYYLKSASPCLEVGPERRLAGARGLTPAIKPKTE
ncbi:MAG: right-handed parallel beta-helix repeat-containing protein [Candidatus Marinimicrobia bacterium]|nr:right-handed parallel beta-helix repeat-containing protein [Candidatus Neomarinimicrobiota bacterium]